MSGNVAAPDRAGIGARIRLPFVIFGGMLALQSSPDLDLTKIAYLVGSILCLVGALATAWRTRRTRQVREVAPWFVAAAALYGLLALSFAVSMAHGTSTTAWIRDAAAYGLFAAVPVFALDGHLSVPRGMLVGMLVIAGLLGGLSWAVEWLARRDILDLPVARLVFPSGQLPGMLYLFAMGMALTAHRRAAWTVVAGTVLALFLITGTRSSLLLLAGPLAMVVVAFRTQLRSVLTPVLSHVVVAAVVVLAFQFALTGLAALAEPAREPGDPDIGSPTASPGPNILGDRFGSLPSLVGSPGSDASITERVAQYAAAGELFMSSPIVGVGPGHPIRWTDVSGYPRSDFTADTPLVMPAKFGVVGILVFAGFAVAYGATLLDAVRRAPRSPVTLAVVGYATTTLVGLPLGFAVEDKGASLALMLLLALAWSDMRARDAADSRADGTASTRVGAPLPADG